MDNIVFGACAKHPKFPLVNCPMCQIEDKQEAKKISQNYINELESRLEAGEAIIQQCRERVASLKKRIDNMKTWRRQNL